MFASVEPLRSFLWGLLPINLLVFDKTEGPFVCSFLVASLLLIFDFSPGPALTFCVIFEKDAFPKVFRGVSELFNADELVIRCGLRRPSFA